ncbi:MAG: MmgE/PrpD family protein [Sulfuricaulis sp.]|nr:MmgE/PrpD family protein [Sulfuricaulis sp.]
MKQEHDQAAGTTSPVTHVLADFALRTSWTDLPERVRSEAVRALVNYVGCALGGSNTTTVEAAMRGIAGLAGCGSTPVFGRSERLDFVNAAVVNCLSSAAHTYDDTHLKTITHPTGPIAAALLALADTRKVSGEDLLLALVLGMEIECRISTAITAPHTGAHGGWYITGVSGGIGAAAAAGRLIGLDHEQLVSSLGLAATQACGLRATHGSMATAYVPALAARNGLTAAYMAKADFACSDISIDGRNGLLQVMSPGADAGAISRNLGAEFEMLNNAYKPYPCGIVIHPTIDACLEIATGHALHPEEIEQIALEVHPGALNLTWRKLPTTVLDAQVSLYHWAAAALVCGEAGLEQGDLSCIQDSRVRTLQSRISVVASSVLSSDQAIAMVRMRNGMEFRAEVIHATGSVMRPMTDPQLEKKFQMLANRVLSGERANELLRVCWGVSALEDVAEVARLATSHGGLMRGEIPNP